MNKAITVESFVSEILNRIEEIVEKYKPKKVIWCGFHPWLWLVYSVLLDLGVKELEVVDNDIFKQGKSILPLSKMYDTNLDYRIIVKSPTELEKQNVDTVVLMANTHFEEIRNQLDGLGVSYTEIINLYEFTINHNKYWEKQSDICKQYQPIRGRELQMIVLDIMKYFKQVCEKNNLKYFIGGGTLLGAVRHNGFIPWDEDIDLYMPYEDYLKLIKLFPQNDRYRLVDWRNEEDFFLPIMQIVDMKTYSFRQFYGYGFCQWRAYIDIAPLAGYPSGEKQIKDKMNQNFENDNRWRYYYFVRNVKRYQGWDPRIQIENEKYKYSFYDSEYIGAMTSARRKPWSNKKELWADTVHLAFEDDFFAAPIGFDEHLKSRYGNYMEIPFAHSCVDEMHEFQTWLIE